MKIAATAAAAAAVKWPQLVKKAAAARGMLLTNNLFKGVELHKNTMTKITNIATHSDT